MLKSSSDVGDVACSVVPRSPSELACLGGIDSSHSMQMQTAALASIRPRWRSNHNVDTMEQKLLALKSRFASDELTEIATNGMTQRTGNVYRTFQRYVTACNGDVNKAEQQLRGTMAFRSSDDFSRKALLRDAPTYDRFEHIFKNMPHGFHGFDATHGTTVYVDNVGMLDSDALLNGFVTERDLVVCHLLMLEYQLSVLTDEATRRKRLEPGADPLLVVDDVTNVIDMTGLRPMKLLSGKGMSFFKTIAVHDQAQYPETLRAAYVVNAPRVFAYVWGVIKYLLDAQVRKKVFVTPPGAASHKVLLEKVFGTMENMPRRFGGTYDGVVLCAQKDEPMLGPEHKKFVDWIYSEKRRLLNVAEAPAHEEELPSLSLEERVQILEKKVRELELASQQGRLSRPPTFKSSQYKANDEPNTCTANGFVPNTTTTFAKKASLQPPRVISSSLTRSLELLVVLALTILSFAFITTYNRYLTRCASR